MWKIDIWVISGFNKNQLGNNRKKLMILVQ